MLSTPILYQNCKTQHKPNTKINIPKIQQKQIITSISQDHCQKMFSSTEDQAVKDRAVRYQKKWYPHAKMMWIEAKREKITDKLESKPWHKFSVDVVASQSEENKTS